jgi:hypothetical protein
LANVDGVPVVCRIAKFYLLNVHRLRSELIGTTHALWCNCCLNRSVMCCCCTASFAKAPSPEHFGMQAYFLVGRHNFCAEGRTAAATLSLPLPPAAQNPGFSDFRGGPGSEADHTLPGGALGIAKCALKSRTQMGSCGQSCASLGIFGP